MNKGFAWFGRHWLGVVNSLLAVYVMLPILAPVLMNIGLERGAGMIYKGYGITCHQLAFRSFFIGGEQPVYPREIADPVREWETFEIVVRHNDHFHTISPTVLDATLMMEARAFLGTPEMGYKTAICQRDLGIFGFLWIGGLLYALLRTRFNIKPLPIILFILIGMTPIGLDGFSQLFGYFREDVALLEPLIVRESPPWMRTLTGAWFGLCIAWTVFPRLDRLE